MDLNISNIISIGALAYSMVQQKELKETYEDQVTNYKKQLDDFKDAVNANLDAMDKTIKDYEESKGAVVDIATGTFIVDLAGIADTLWSSAASITIKNNDKTHKLNLYAVILDWGIMDSNGNEYTASWLQWTFFGKEQSTIDCGKERLFKLYGTGHEELYKNRSTRKAIRKIIKNGNNLFSKVRDSWYPARGRMYLVTLVGDGSRVNVSDGIEVTGQIHYYGEGRVLAPSNRYTSYNGELALKWYKDGTLGNPAAAGRNTGN